MANDITFVTAFKNLGAFAKHSAIDIDLTPYFRGIGQEDVKVDYDYFHTLVTNDQYSYYHLNRIFTTFQGSSTEYPDTLDDTPGFFKAYSRWDIYTNQEAGYHDVFLVKLGTSTTQGGTEKTWYLYCTYYFSGKDNSPGSVDGFWYEYGIRDNADYLSAHILIPYKSTKLAPESLIATNIEAMFYFGAGYCRIEDETIPEDQRYIFTIFAERNYPSSMEPWYHMPLPLTLDWSSSILRSTGTPMFTEALNGIPGYTPTQMTDFAFIDFPEFVSDRDVTVDLDVEEYSPEAGPASDEDGMKNPSHDDSSDSIDVPNAPAVGVTDVGFVNVYKTGSNSLQNMGVELFPPLTYSPPQAITGSDTTAAIVNGFNAIVSFLANIPSFFDQMVANTLINYIIDCHMIPVSPNTSGSPESIKVGYKTLTRATGEKVTSDYVDVDCESISLAEYGENFADFLENVKLYLPFIGFVSARPEWFKRTSLQVKYRFNIIDGSFVAYVLSTGRYVNNNNSGKTIVGQYAGNACVHLPITGVTYSNMISGLVGAGSGAIAGAASGNIAAVATSALSAANLHGDIAQSNAYSASAAFMGCRRPFLLIERPVSNYSATYQKELGIPSNISKKLGSVTGFTMVGKIHLDGISATDKEKAEIESLLHEGVIL